MNAPARRPRSVIVGVDGSTEAQRALHWAAGEARRRCWPLRIVHAIEADDSDVAQKVVDAALEEVREAWPGLDVAGEWVVGSPPTALARTTTEHDILVVGSRGLGRVAAVLEGSIGSALARHATCPVVVVRDPNASPSHPDGAH